MLRNANSLQTVINIGAVAERILLNTVMGQCSKQDEVKFAYVLTLIYKDEKYPVTSMELLALFLARNKYFGEGEQRRPSDFMSEHLKIQSDALLHRLTGENKRSHFASENNKLTLVSTLIVDRVPKEVAQYVEFLMISGRDKKYLVNNNEGHNPFPYLNPQLMEPLRRFYTLQSFLNFFRIPVVAMKTSVQLFKVGELQDEFILQELEKNFSEARESASRRASQKD